MTVDEKQKAIDALKISAPVMVVTQEEFYDYIHTLNKIIDWLKQEPMWIPVTKRQPKKSGKYWCTFGGTNLTGTDYYTTESDAKELFDDPEEYAGWKSQNVVAWMPLPEPYTAESEG